MSEGFLGSDEQRIFNAPLNWYRLTTRKELFGKHAVKQLDRLLSNIDILTHLKEGDSYC